MTSVKFKVPEFLSTHPSNENRIADLTAHAKKLKQLYLDNKITNKTNPI